MIEQHLEKLRGFFELAEEGSMIRASKKVALSQPAISKSLRNLEDVVGQPLFIRSRSGMILTPSGRKLHSFCQMLFARIEDLEKSIESLDEMSGILKIGTYETLAETVWPHVLDALSKRYPKLEVQIKTESSSSLWRELANGSIDMIVDAEPQTNQPYFSRVLFEDRFGIYKKTGVEIHQDNLSFLPMSYVDAALDRNGDRIADHLRRLGLNHRLVFDVQNFTFVRSLTIRGLCVGVLPERLASNHLLSEELEPFLVGGKRISFGPHRICATYPEHMRNNRRIKEVSRMMAELLRKPL